MSAPSWFMAGLLAGAAAMLGAVLLWRASRAAIRRGRQVLLAGGIMAVAAVAAVAGMSLAIDSHQGTTTATGESVMADSPTPTMPPSGATPSPAATPTPSAMSSPVAMSSTSTMPSASVMSRILAMPSTARAASAEPMDEAAANLADRLQRQGGTAADWNLLAQAYDFLGRPDEAQRARARAAAVGATQRSR